MSEVPDRPRTMNELIEMARFDARIVAAARVGGSAQSSDEWSDVDLAFGVRSDVDLAGVIASWTRDMVSHFSAVVLFDLPFQSTMYRVFLLPGLFQVDLSFTPAEDFGALGPRFEPIFGEAVSRPFLPRPEAENLFGLGVHHAVRGFVSIKRSKPWQAEYWISSLRDCALMLASLRYGLDARHGRGFDQLPDDIGLQARSALITGLTDDELAVALAAGTALLLREGDRHQIQIVTTLRNELTAILCATPAT